MSSIMVPGNILAALNSLESELPSLTGKEAWETIKDEFSTLRLRLRDSNDPEERDRLASELIDLLVPYEHARDGLNEEIRLQHIRAVLRDTMETDLPAFAKAMGLDKKIVEPSAAVALESIMAEPEDSVVSAEAGVRFIKIKEGGKDVGKTIKIRNFHLDLAMIGELAASITMTADKMIHHPDPQIVVAGVLLIIRSLTRAITIQLSEQETSVFWGFVLARDADNVAEEGLITKYTNKERAKIGLLPLTNEQVKNILCRLKALKSVELMEGEQDIWRIVEKYKIEY
jgi:pterin-4a-carbinolamine dehydratase